MNKENPSFLRKRWTKAQLAEASNQFYTGNLIGGFFAKIIHENISYEDFRGFTLDLASAKLEYEESIWKKEEKTPQPKHFDFSYSRSSGNDCPWYFRKASMCVFRKCNFKILQFWKDVRDCDFSGSKMIGCMLGQPWKGKFIRCNFHSCNLSRAQNHNINFEDCDFGKANMKRVFLGTCTFKNCSFKDARLEDANVTRSTFISCDLQGLDFSAVWCSEVKFKGCKPNRLDKVRGVDAILEPY